MNLIFDNYNVHNTILQLKTKGIDKISIPFKFVFL